MSRVHQRDFLFKMAKALLNLDSLTDTQKKILEGFADPDFYETNKGKAEEFCEKYKIHPSVFYSSFNNPYFCQVFFNQRMQFVMASIPGGQGIADLGILCTA